MKKIIEKWRNSRIGLLFVVVLAVVSCCVVGVYAKYISEIKGKSSIQVAPFIIKTEKGENNQLLLTPTINGTYVSYEFYVSNADGNVVSGVSQYYSIGLLVPTTGLIQLMNAMSQDKNFMFMPVLVVTNKTDMTFAELMGYYENSENIPDGVEIGLFDYFQPVEEITEEYLASNEYVPFTWFESDATGENFSPVSIHSSAGESLELKHFIVFVAGGRTLNSNENYDLSGTQVVVYSEQTKIGE